jgi:hypothetical protein
MNAAFAITEPTEDMKAFLKLVEDPRGWKYPVTPICCSTKKYADEVAAAMDFYYGGHEMTEARTAGRGRHAKTVWLVGSMGYYHYVGS